MEGSLMEEGGSPLVTITCTRTAERAPVSATLKGFPTAPHGLQQSDLSLLLPQHLSTHEETQPRPRYVQVGAGVTNSSPCVNVWHINHCFPISRQSFLGL